MTNRRLLLYYMLLAITAGLFILSSCARPEHETNESEEEVISWFGGTYHGYSSNALPHGQGVWTNPDGEYYLGEWEFGLRTGYGEWSNRDGDTYKGNWSENMRHGYGIFTSLDGKYYEGEWSDDLYHGRGTLINSKGDQYEGQFSKGYFHGYGIYISADGEKYEGSFESGQRHGEGVLTDADGTVEEGIWLHGEKIEEAPPAPVNKAVSSSDYEVRGLLFFESGETPAGIDKRLYDTSFDRNTVRIIYWELELLFPESNRSRELEITWRCYLPGGKAMRETYLYTIPAGQNRHYLTGGRNVRILAVETGIYKVDILSGKGDWDIIASGSFKVN